MLKLDPKNTELLAQKQTVLNKSIEATQDRLKQLQDIKENVDNAMANGTKISEENYRNLQREIINTQIKLSDLKNENSKFTKFGDWAINAGERLKKFANKIDSLGNKLSTRLSIPIAGALTAATKEAVEFESAFTGVTKTVDGTEEQLEDLKKGIKRLAKEIPSTTTEISAVAEAAGQLGIETDNVLEFTKTMINMGNATNLSAEEAATTLARFANVTRMRQSDFGRLGSVIVALGNNFATTESEIAAMGMNLGSAGKQVGMSQSQIMALATALSSVGLEAQAGGTAFSKVMVNMQLAVEKGGKNLKDFASVAGMTSKEFKQAFQKDATKAIMAFIKGLSKGGEQGKSAIKILDDMGIKETRLRDALLRSANASDVMSKAIDLGNKAWEENNALTNEADKRYKTTESQLKIAQNKIKDLAVSLGDKLLPIVNQILDKVGKWIDELDKLSDGQKENIVKIGLLVAAAGPALKIFGKIISTVGSVSKGIGTFSKAISLAKNGIGSATGSAATLAKVFKALTSPTGLAVAGITAVTGALIYLATQETEQQKRAKELANSIGEAGKSLDEYNQKIDENASKELSQIDNVQKLKGELDKLVDENGKVKKSDEARAKFIIEQLNGALGTELKLTDGQIDNYKALQEEIDKLIEKKRAEIKLTAEEEKYKKAIEAQGEATENLKKVLDELGMTYDEAKSKAEEYQKRMEQGTDINDLLKDGNLGLIASFTEADDQVKTHTEAIKQYEDDYALFTEGKYNEIGKTVKTTTQNWTDTSLKEIQDSINEQQKSLEHYKQIYDATGNEVAKKSYEQAQTNLNNLTNELKSRTTTIGLMSADEIKAWATLAKENRTKFNEEMEKTDGDTKKQLEAIAKAIDANKDLPENKMDLLAKYMSESFTSMDSSKWGADLIQGLAGGIRQKARTVLEAAIQEVTNKIHGNLHFSRPDFGPLRDYETWMPDMIKGLSKSLIDASPLLEKSTQILGNKLKDSINIADFDNYRGLKNQIINSTRTVFTTPQITFNVQELDEARLQQCFNYINKKFGSAY